MKTTKRLFFSGLLLLVIIGIGAYWSLTLDDPTCHPCNDFLVESLSVDSSTPDSTTVEITGKNLNTLKAALVTPAFGDTTLQPDLFTTTAKIAGVATEGWRGALVTTGGRLLLFKFDRQNRLEVERIWDLNLNPLAIRFHRGLIYITARLSGLHIIDPSVHGQKPKTLGFFPVTLTNGRMTFNAGTLYIAGGKAGVLALDIDDPRHPREEQRFAQEMIATAVQVIKDVAYVLSVKEGLSAYRLTLETPPTLLFTQPHPSNGARMALGGGWLALSSGHTGLQVFQLNQPEGPPTEKHHFAGLPPIFSLHIKDGQLAVGHQGGVSILDLNTNEQKLHWTGHSIDHRVVYSLADSPEGLLAISRYGISSVAFEPANSLASTPPLITDPQAHLLCMDKSIYVSETNRLKWFIPQKKGRWSTAGQVNFTADVKALTKSGNTLLVLLENDQLYALRPQKDGGLTRRWKTKLPAEVSAVFASEIWLVAKTKSKAFFYRLAKGAPPRLIGQDDQVPGWAMDSVVHDSTVYMACDKAGIFRYDLSDNGINGPQKAFAFPWPQNQFSRFIDLEQRGDFLLAATRQPDLTLFRIEADGRLTQRSEANLGHMGAWLKKERELVIVKNRKGRLCLLRLDKEGRITRLGRLTADAGKDNFTFWEDEIVAIDWAHRLRRYPKPIGVDIEQSDSSKARIVLPATLRQGDYILEVSNGSSRDFKSQRLTLHID